MPGCEYKHEYWDLNECKPKKIYMEDCSQNIECLDSEQTKCSSDGKCRCPEGHYFSKEARSCVKQLVEWETCEENEMCLSEMSCNQYACSCGQDKFFRKTTNKCIEKKSLNAYCNKDDECSDKKNLLCLNKNCSCSKEKYTWNTNAKRCKLTYSMECNDHDDCDESKGLQCIDYLDRCFCPSNKSGKICDCKKNEQYWNGLKCISKKSFSNSCKMSSECRKDLVCLDSMCRCQFYEKENKVSKSASEADSYCKSLTVGSEDDWKLAKISPGIENEFASYVRHRNIKGDFWIKDKNGKMKNFRINSFYNDITLKTPLKKPKICLSIFFNEFRYNDLRYNEQDNFRLTCSLYRGSTVLGTQEEQTKTSLLNKLDSLR
ncbi:prion-like-(Q N-rich) domain-bearing 25 [Brachionus plicatilis]|uniref:Prion-like-(Q N-rich) domain-bearing 25 n=1 Tax=Brachionus plicatilis TaxID=10195 RepID=A0A3M7Q1J8_BRAPC|nr:prion-like-(Q N-rich) domain-bearing 25 [Brachionus plicatilis]